MKTKASNAAVFFFPAVLLFLLCGELNDPWTDPDSAKIRGERSLTSLPSRININQEYPCSLFILLPELADSVTVVSGQTGGETLLWRSGPLTGADTAIAFSLVFPAGAGSPVTVCLHRKNGNIDSLSKTLQFRYPPQIAPAPSLSTYNGIPVTVEFSLTDPDGDIQSCHLWIDSTTGQAVVPPLNRSGTAATVSYPVSSPSFDTLLVFAQAFDSTGNVSALAACTVFVLDTVKPHLSFVRLSPSINDSVVDKQPCSLLVKVLDASPIDSAAYTGNPLFDAWPMTMISDTVALAILADLDSGANYYEVQAWDRAGNQGKLRVPIHYTGSSGYKFTFSNISERTISENGMFPSLNLDNCISLDPPPVGVPNWKADVQWQIQEGIQGAGIKATFTPATRTVTFAVVDSEWNGSESFTFYANWNNSAATGGASANYRVNPVNDAPVIRLKTITKLAGRKSFDTIWADTCVTDPDNKPSSVSWTNDTAKGKIYTLNWVSSFRTLGKESADPAIVNPVINIDLWMRKWTVVPKDSRKLFVAGILYTDTLRLIARDPLGGADTQNVIVRATY